MAIMRSTIKSGGGDWLGIQKASLKTVTDDSAKWDWADVYLTLEFDIEGSQYPKTCRIAGSFDTNPDGTIMDCSLLRRITYALDAFGFQGGVNQHGKWVNEQEEPIDDIASFLETNFGSESPKYEYLVYIFKEQGKNGKLYTRIHNKFLKNTSGAEAELTSYMDFLRKKGYLKEATEAAAVVPATDLELDGLEIANL